MTIRASVLVLAALTAWIGVRPDIALAQGADYPNKTVRLIVPLPAGGSYDVSARIFAKALQARLGQPFIVENKPGAGGILAHKAVVNSPPDGYTLLVATPILAATPISFKDAGFDPIRDLAYICQTNLIDVALAVNANVPAKNLSELLAHVRANPGKLNFGIPASGATMLLSHQVQQQLKLDALMVPYKGATELQAAMLANEAQIGFNGIGILAPAFNSGTLRPIAVAGAKRSSQLPDVPTLGESGVDIRYSAYSGFAAPAGTPSNIIAKLEREIIAAANDPAVREAHQKLGMPIETAPSAEFGSMMAREIQTWLPVAKAAGIEPQ